MKNWQPVAPFDFLPAIAWVLIIDFIDIPLTLIDAVATVFGFGIGGFITNEIFDVLQSGLIFLVFRDPTKAIVNADFILPQGLDLFPSYTVYYLLTRNR